MKVRQLLRESIKYSFESKEEGMAYLFDTLMLSPIKVDAHYSDYPSIEEETEEAYDEFFRRFGAEGDAGKGYSMRLDDTDHLKQLIDAAEEFFNDPDFYYGEPGLEWPFTFEVTA